MLDNDEFTFANAGAPWQLAHTPITISDSCLGVVHTFYHRIWAFDSVAQSQLRFRVNDVLYPGYEQIDLDPLFISSTQGHRIYGVHLKEGDTFVTEVRLQAGGSPQNWHQVRYYAWEWAATPEREYDQIT
jgi:hypothetical protein